MSILEIKNFYQKYNDNVVVNDLSLTVSPGEIFGFIGHNGAGKSTTIKSIVGILPIYKGDILIDGMSITTNKKKCQRMLAYIPDNPDLYEYMTGIEYINFICDIYEFNDDRLNRIKSIADDFEITEYLGNLISSYSHGMRQKVSLIAAFVHNPKLLVLDEPFVGLDPKAAIVLKKYMKKLCSEGNSIFFSTHVLDVAERLCSRIAMLDHGNLIFNEKACDLLKDKTLEEIFLEKASSI